jgi:hypothetical protein
MHPLEIAKADESLKFGKGRRTALRRPQLITGGKGVTGIQTDAHPALVFDTLDDLRQMLKRPAQIAALPAVFSMTAVTPLVRSSAQLIDSLTSRRLTASGICLR